MSHHNEECEDGMALQAMEEGKLVTNNNDTRSPCRHHPYYHEQNNNEESFTIRIDVCDTVEGGMRLNDANDEGSPQDDDEIWFDAVVDPLLTDEEDNEIDYDRISDVTSDELYFSPANYSDDDTMVMMSPPRVQVSGEHLAHI